MSYTATITITVPAELYSVACAIARALDPDVGGAESFGPQIDGALNYETTTPCTAAFAQQAIAMTRNPALLHYAVAADYATRWPDFVAPTLVECQSFCAAASISSSTSADPTP